MNSFLFSHLLLSEWLKRQTQPSKPWSVSIISPFRIPIGLPWQRGQRWQRHTCLCVWSMAGSYLGRYGLNTQCQLDVVDNFYCRCRTRWWWRLEIATCRQKGIQLYPPRFPLFQRNCNEIKFYRTSSHGAAASTKLMSFFHNYYWARIWPTVACIFRKLHNSIQERRHHAIAHVTLRYYSSMEQQAAACRVLGLKQICERKKNLLLQLQLVATTIRCMMQLSPNGALLVFFFAPYI